MKIHRTLTKRRRNPGRLSPGECTATRGQPHCWDARMHPCLCSVAQSRLVLCNPLDWGLPASSVHGTSRQEYWSGSPFPPSGDLPYPGMEPVSLMSPASQADSLALSHLGSSNTPITFPKCSCDLCLPSTPESRYAPIISGSMPLQSNHIFSF